MSKDDMEECPECGSYVEVEEYITDTESYEYWGARCSQEIPVGYICPECGKAVYF